MCAGNDETLTPQATLECAHNGYAHATGVGPSTVLSDVAGYTAHDPASCTWHTTIASHLDNLFGSPTPSASTCDPIPYMLPVNTKNALVCSGGSTSLTDLETCATSCCKAGHTPPSAAMLAPDTSAAAVFVPSIFAGQAVGVGMASDQGVLLSSHA